MPVPRILYLNPAEVGYYWKRGRKLPSKNNHRHKIVFGCYREKRKEL